MGSAIAGSDSRITHSEPSVSVTSYDRQLKSLINYELKKVHPLYKEVTENMACDPTEVLTPEEIPAFFNDFKAAMEAKPAYQRASRLLAQHKERSCQEAIAAFDEIVARLERESMESNGLRAGLEVYMQSLCAIYDSLS